MSRHEAEQYPGKVLPSSYTVFCCNGKDCRRYGAGDVHATLSHQARKHGLKKFVDVVRTECMDECKHGPIVIICREGGGLACDVVRYRGISAKSATRIVQQHLVEGVPLDEKRMKHP